jgi:hypothetical protein
MLKVNTAMIMELIKESVFEEKKTLLAMHQLGPYYWVRLVIPIAKSIALKPYLVRYCFFNETFRIT